jgi:hypothetical protein
VAASSDRKRPKPKQVNRSKVLFNRPVYTKNASYET